MFFSDTEMAFIEEMAWRTRIGTKAGYICSLLHEEMKKHPDVVDAVKKVNHAEN